MDCHNEVQDQLESNNGTIALVGHPNVGKSVIFQLLTGRHVTVSNYPGTTVEVSRGNAKEIPDTVIVDTPGVITFPPHSEDEMATASVLLKERLKAILQVGDAKNLRRTLLLTVQLAEMGLPMVLALNMMDEADARGVEVNHKLLSEHLSIPIIPTTAIRGQGINEVTEALKGAHHPLFRLSYPLEIESMLAEISVHLPEAPVTTRALGLLWLSDDTSTDEWFIDNLDLDVYRHLVEQRESLRISFLDSLTAVIQTTRLEFVEQATSVALIKSGSDWKGFSWSLGHWMTHPIWGLPILAAVLYALYWFVGVFGAGTLVDMLEIRLFGEIINPFIVTWLNRLIPYQIVIDLLVGEYGLWTIGMTYAFALILPIVSTFFLAFGIMEDSGYLPRLAALTNRIFRSMGLNGKAVLPMVLGLGCVTMATLTTRILEKKRERLLVTLLLALAIPCSAQLGVVLGLLASISFQAMMIWSGVVVLVLLAAGWIAAKLVPGERTSLLVELPPLRIPVLSNVIAKTVARMEWYLKEVVPLFLIGTAALFLLDKIGALDFLIKVGEPLVVGWLGLPAETSAAFLMGFLRRDFGAAGLFIMRGQGLLNPLQVVVAMVTITLFIPCIASVLVIQKERGWKITIGILVLVFPLAFLVGGLLNKLLLAIGWGV